MKDLLNLSFISESGTVKTESDGSQSLYVKRVPIGEKFLSSNPLNVFMAEGEIKMEEYAVIEYSAFGLLRPINAFSSPLVTLKKNDEWVDLFRFPDLTLDGKKHTIIMKAPTGTYEGAKISFGVDKVLEAYLNIHKLYTCKRDELPTACENGKNVPGNPFTPIDISGMFNKEYNFDEYDSFVDSGRFFDKENVSLYGIPFNVKISGNNLIAPPPPPSENDEIIENFGAKCKRRICRPISRDGETVIKIDKNVSEIYFILTLCGKRHMRVNYGTDPSILGSAQCDINAPLNIDDTEMFMAEVVYKDGKRDTHLPLNLYTSRHGISGDIGVYGIPCFGEAESLVIHNRHLDVDVNVAAVTVNETDNRLYPDMLIPKKPSKIERVFEQSKKAFFDGNTFTLKNGALMMKFDISEGLFLTEMSNAYTPNLAVKKAAILKTRAADGTINDKFMLVNAAAGGEKASLTYMYEGARFEITADISGENNIKWNLEITNEGNEEFRKGIIFPTFSNVDFGSFDDNWYYLPKYQNINSNETFYMYEESAPSFPLQFMDVYSPEMLGGLCISTQEPELVTRKYSLNKDKNGIEIYVEYPIIYGDIASGEKFTASPCLISAHEGDWKKAFEIYKTWLDSWYVPYKCQDKQWYRECFWLLAEITDFFENRDMCSFPCWYDPDTKEFKFRKILEEQKKIAGVYPDILHMWSWCTWWRNGRYGHRWGNYGKEDYDYYGGQEIFANALHDIRDNMGVQISLYMHPTLLSNTYPKHEKFYETSMVKSESGGKIGFPNDSYRMCHAEEQWRKESLSMYPRLYSELKIPLLYIDEFSLRIDNRCYANNHGHHLPSNLLKTDRDYISRLKDMMPEEVVLYGEYAAADVNARYIDCNISYYILDTIVDMIETTKRANDGDDRLSRVFLHAYRFAFPKIVQLILPMAMRNLSWHPQKFLFFNAEAVYDSFWDNEESHGLDFNVKAYKLKKKYADCYTSDCPETMIETESPAICMNKFPSKTSDRVVYNIYNRAYSTFRGVALKVSHKEGATYYDAWNEKPLKVTVADGIASIELEIDAQQMGCIVIE